MPQDSGCIVQPILTILALASGIAYSPITSASIFPYTSAFFASASG